MKFAREEGHLPQAVLPAIGRIPPVLGYLQLGLAEYLARKASLNKNVLCGSLGTVDHWGQANVFIISCTHSISSTSPDQESTSIFPIQLIKVQSMPYRTWPVPRARSLCKPARAEWFSENSSHSLSIVCQPLRESSASFSERK